MKFSRRRESVQGVFSEDEYRADAAKVIAYAVKTGRAIVTRADGSARVVISIPAAEVENPMTGVRQ